MVFMTDKEWNMVSELLVNGDVKGLVRELPWRTYDVDEETMKQIQQLVEKRKKTVGKDTVASVSDVARLADELEQQKHLIAWRFLHKIPHIMDVNRIWCGNWNEAQARSLAVEAFKVAGYDPNKYDFDVRAKTANGFRVVVTVKEPDIPEGYTLADGRIVDKE